MPTTEAPAATSAAYADLCALLREAGTIDSIARLCSWDQETDMPPKAAAFRAEELALLSRLGHERLTSPRLGDLLAECEADANLTADAAVAANLREIRRDYDKATRLPADLVAEIAETASRAMEVWKEARSASDFALFRPWLEKSFGLARRKAECLGAPAGGVLYDALLDEYEPGVTSADVERVFGPLREALTPLIAEIASAPTRPSRAPDEVKVDRAAQVELNKHAAAALGFDFSAGRLAVSTHPFSEGLAPGDTRMTTRYFDDRFTDSLAATLHETGHSLYEQGLPKAEFPGQPLGRYISLGVHESQSRLWENQVGRSRPFWEWMAPIVKDRLGPGLARFGVDDFYGCVNVVEPTFIRVEADEATYHLHVMMRFDLERLLIAGDLAVADVPGWWNARIKADLGLSVPDDARGCLQDIHWSMGAIGYFATYSLGSLLAAQMWETAQRAIPGVEAGFARGRFAPLLDWLREHIHRHGRRFTSAQLTERLTGAPLSHEPLMRYLESKLRPLYGL
ncbi:MAG: carboxypeptidase M32 [Planctomycetota bacterium]|nr:MAG: carboxypeptidase M32 [Planctomycetota bacterium]